MIFVVLLAWTLGKYGENSRPVSTASMALSVVEGETLIWVTLCMQMACGAFQIKLGHENILMACAVLIYIIIRVVNYFLCVYRKAYVPLLEEFQAKGGPYRKRAYALLWGYIWGTVAALAIILVM